jgi:hypothetical protein
LIPTIKTHKMKRDEMLVPRLNFLMPMNFFLSQDWQLNFGVDSKTAIGRVVELNPEWVIAVVNNLEHRLTDVLHDFKGIYAEDEHFLPRIAGEEFEPICEVCDKDMTREEHDFCDICPDCRDEDILGDFDENGDAVDVKKYQSDAWVDAQNDACIDENGDEIGKSIMDSVKVNGYTNIQTYRLCLVLDNTEYWKEDILQTFFRLVREDEFNANDINLIDWNEVIKRYSDDLIETHIHHHNK